MKFRMCQSFLIICVHVLTKILIVLDNGILLVHRMLLMKGVSESMAGRVAIFQLLPLSSEETRKVSIFQGRNFGTISLGKVFTRN